MRTKTGQRAVVGTVAMLAMLFPLAFDPLATQMDVAIFVSPT